MARLALLLLLFAAAVQAGLIKGRVISALNRKPIPDAVVEVASPRRFAVTDSSGRFLLDSLPPGSYDLSVGAPEYESLIVSNVILLGNAAEEREIELLPPTVALADKKVKAKSTARIFEMPNSTHVMDGEEIRRAPGGLMDVQRVIQKFPGVQSRGDNTNEVIARGGFPGENLFILDEIEIPNPNYFGNQGTGGGVISVVNPLMVKKLTFNAGAPPARYGGKASSVLDISLKDGNEKMIFGGLDLGFAGAGLLAEGPLWDGATFLGSFRKSYLDFVAEFEPSTAIPRFWGGQAKVVQKTAGAGKFTAGGLFGRSSITIENAKDDFGIEGDAIKAGGDVVAAGGTWSRYLGDHWEFMATVSGTGNVVTREQYFKGSDEVLGERETMEYENTVKAEAAWFPSRKVKWTFGGEFKRIDFEDRNRGLPDTLKFHASAADTVGTPALDSAGRPVTRFVAPSASFDTHKEAAFAQANFPLTGRLSAAAGLRAERSDLNGEWSLMPRASLRWSLQENLEATAGAGLQSQPQNLLDHAARGENRDLPLKRAATGSVELDWYPRRLLSNVSLNAYVKRYDNLLLDSLYSASGPLYQFRSSPARLDDGEALSRGVELFLERKLADHWFSSLAYSFSESETRFDGANGGEAFPSDFDYTHVANLSGGAVFDMLGKEWWRRMREKTWFKSLCWLIPLGDRLEGSFRLRYATGRPYTALSYDASYRRWVLASGDLNSERFPDYLTLDLRFERRIGYGWLRMMYYFDLQNVLARDNVFTYVYNDKNGKRVTVNQLPFFPMGGFIIGF